MIRSFIPLLVLAYFIIGALMYAAATPIFEAPDEASHFLYAHNLQTTGQLPILEDRKTVFASKAVQRHHPPLYYLLGSLALTGTRRGNLSIYLQDNPFARYGTMTTYNANVLLHPLQPSAGDTMQAAWRLRLLSLLWACGTLWCIYRVGLMAFGQSIGLLAMFVAASIPSFVAISASINNDNAVTFFYSAGIAWVVWVWQKRTICVQDGLILGAILAGAALSKVTGLTLMGFVGLVLLWGGLNGRLLWKALFQTGVIAGISVCLLAGWWYLRNLQLYGDPLALSATHAIWGRSLPTDPKQIISEAWGVWESFWFVLGHFNVRGPEWLYPSVIVISVMAVLGLMLQYKRFPKQRSSLFILLTAVGIVLGALIVATRSINVSQGRILFPAMAAFCPLLVIGLRAWGKWALWGLAPLVIAHLITPFAILAPIFAPLRPVEALPAKAIPLEAGNEWVKILGYHITPDLITPDDSIRVRLYLRGMHPANPALFLKIIDPVSLVPIGGADLYPGMTPLSQFDPNTLYEIDVTLPIDRTRLTGRTPRRLDLFVGLRPMTASDPLRDEGISIPWVIADGTTVDFLQMPAVMLIDPDYVPFVPTQLVGVVYAKAMELVSYSVMPETVSRGQSVSITLVWRSIGPMSEDWTLALGLLDASGKVIAQADGPLPGYPTSLWRTGTMTEDTRKITIPVIDTMPGDLHLFVGWYRPTDWTQRLTAQGPNIDNDLYLSPPVITVR